MAVILGELFVSGYFYDPKEEVTIDEDLSAFIAIAVVYSIATALLMIPLNVTMGVFLKGKEIEETNTREDIEKREAKLPLFRKIGYLLIGAWIVFSGYAISMFVINFNDNAMNKWLSTFFMTFFTDVIVIANLKLLITLLIGVLLMRIVKWKMMLAIAAGCAGKIVEIILKYF